ncbi:hypothetical protein BDV98DRAFT_558096 [Pterulicium gracile]|uniref:Uncharacterized protein n=1 Tax=Pterulicium gracile TaxID=1884261 RepID=A0A5C3R452_9AGAR|nr:hypothetical protein BDV98DRAFT_558096 [Pterula gracilis]
MPRRAPPTALKLVPANQPLPSRYEPKHTLPSLPRAALQTTDTMESMTRRVQSRDIGLPTAMMVRQAPEPRKKRLRGPWDDSSCISVTLDLDSYLKRIDPVALSN